MVFEHKSEKKGPTGDPISVTLGSNDPSKVSGQNRLQKHFDIAKRLSEQGNLGQARRFMNIPSSSVQQKPVDITTELKVITQLYLDKGLKNKIKYWYERAKKNAQYGELDLALDDLSNIKELIFIYKGYTSDQRYNYELIHNAILLEFAQLGFASMLYNVGRSLETEDYTSYCRTYNGLDHAVAIITEQINLIKLTFKSSEMQKSHVLYEWEECLYNLKEWKQLFLMSMDLIDLLDMFMDTLDDLNERKLISSSDKKNLVAVCLELQHKTRNKEDVHEDKEYINYEELVIKLKHNWINLIEFPNLLLNVIQIQHEEQHLHEFFEALGD